MRRPWPERIERNGASFQLVWCESGLELRERLAAFEETSDGNSSTAGIREDTRQPSAVEQPAPDFTLQDADGREVSLADFRGKVVVAAGVPRNGACGAAAALPHMPPSSISALT